MHSQNVQCTAWHSIYFCAFKHKRVYCKKAQTTVHFYHQFDSAYLRTGACLRICSKWTCLENSQASIREF